MYCSFPNVDNSNNEILILINGQWERITIAIGCYDIRDINNEIKRQIGDRGGGRGGKRGGWVDWLRYFSSSLFVYRVQ